MKKCCNITKKNNICKRKDGKTFKLPRRFSKKKCLTQKIRGFSMRSSCAPFKFCKTQKQNGGVLLSDCIDKTNIFTLEELTEDDNIIKVKPVNTHDYRCYKKEELKTYIETQLMSFEKPIKDPFRNELNISFIEENYPELTELLSQYKEYYNTEHEVIQDSDVELQQFRSYLIEFKELDTIGEMSEDGQIQVSDILGNIEISIYNLLSSTDNREARKQYLREINNIIMSEYPEKKNHIDELIDRITYTGGKKQFLYNPNDPKKSFDVYIDKDPSDTIPIKYSSVKDVENTIKKLEKLYKTGKYSHKRIWQVGMIMKVRLEAMKKHKKTMYPNAKEVSKRYYLANKYFKFLGKRTKVEGEEARKKLKFNFF